MESQNRDAFNKNAGDSLARVYNILFRPAKISAGQSVSEPDACTMGDFFEIRKKFFENPLTNGIECDIICEYRKNGTISYAGMAELADALDSGSSRGNSVKVQVLLPA